MKNALHIKDIKDNKYKFICPLDRVEVKHKKTLNNCYQLTYIAICPVCKQDFLVCD